MFACKIDENLELRTIEHADAREVFRLTEESRSHLREFLPWLDFTVELEDTRNFIQGSIEKYDRREGMVTVVLYRGEIVGVAGFNELDWKNKVAYIGYWLGEQYQGRGIMTKTAAALTGYAFTTLDMDKVDIRAALQNKKSRAVPKRLGFTEEGVVRQAEWLYDHYVDHVVYGMLKEEWLKAHGN